MVGLFFVNDGFVWKQFKEKTKFLSVVDVFDGIVLQQSRERGQPPDIDIASIDCFSFFADLPVHKSVTVLKAVSPTRGRSKVIHGEPPSNLHRLRLQNRATDREICCSRLMEPIQLDGFHILEACMSRAASIYLLVLLTALEDGPESRDRKTHLLSKFLLALDVAHLIKFFQKAQFLLYRESLYFFLEYTF